MNKKLYDWLFADIEEIIDMADEQNGQKRSDRTHTRGNDNHQNTAYVQGYGR